MTDDLSYMNEDAVLACADLVERAGAARFEIGYLHDDVPVDRADWYAVAYYRGARLTADRHQSPSAAATALAERILRGGTCRCGRPAALSGDHPNRCRWRLMGRRWEPGCDAPAIEVQGARGDPEALRRAMEAASANRAERRRRR